MYVFSLFSVFLTTLASSLAAPLSSYRPGEVAPSTTVDGTTVTHGRCDIHIRQRLRMPYFDEEATPGIIDGYILDNNRTEIGKLESTWYGMQNEPAVVEFYSRLDGVLLIEPGRMLNFSLGEDNWHSTDDRCNVGKWNRLTWYGLEWKRATRHMDCGFDC